MVGRPKNYRQGVGVNIYVDVDVLNAFEKLGLNRSVICNRAMVEAVRTTNSTEGELVKELEELKEQQKILVCDVASKEAGLKSFREKLVLEGEKAKEQAKKQEYAQAHCIDCDVSLGIGSEKGYCKNCKWKHVGKSKGKAET